MMDMMVAMEIVMVVLLHARNSHDSLACSMWGLNYRADPAAEELENKLSEGPKKDPRATEDDTCRQARCSRFSKTHY